MRRIITGVIAFFVVSAAASAFAEGFFDLYAGASFTDNATVRLRSNAAVTSGDVGFTTGTTYGLRGGYWLKPLPWFGIGGDFSSLHARGKDTKFDILPITPMALFRLQLFTDEEVPQGWVQPYIGIGPSVSLYTYAHTSLGTPNNSISGTDSIGSAVGFQLPAGFNIQLSRRVALFTEYRYAFYKVDVDRDYDSQFTVSITNSNNLNRNVKTDLSMHNVLSGISFRF